MLSVYRLFLILMMSFFLSSCATIFNGSNQQINITSTPFNATVTIDEKVYGKTPIIVELSRKNNHIVKIELEGYEPEIITLTRKNSNWFLGNCLIGGLIGMGIDALTGAMYILKPEEIKSTLKPDMDSTSFNEDTLMIQIVMNQKPSWQKIGQLKKL